MFLDSVEDGSDPKSLTNLHNNEAGRVVSQFHCFEMCVKYQFSGV